MNYQLGKLPRKTDSRTLAFAQYTKKGLPHPPADTNYGDKVPSWPMYDNDRYGDCTCAAAGHMVQNWTANAEGEFTPTSASVVRFYEHFVGTPGPEAGCNMLDVLKYWHKHGLDRHKVYAFTSIDPTNATEAKEAIWLLGSIYIGVALPNFAVQADDLLQVPWVVPAGGAVGNAAPNDNNGHCIPAVGYDADNLYVITWAAVKKMSWDFYHAYADEAYAVLSQDFIDKNGETGEGLDLAQLSSDLNDLATIPADQAKITIGR